MVPAKYREGDVVTFIHGKEHISGVVVVVDWFGTVEQHEEPSYDIRDKKNNVYYKHVRQSWIIE